MATAIENGKVAKIFMLVFAAHRFVLSFDCCFLQWPRIYVSEMDMTKNRYRHNETAICTMWNAQHCWLLLNCSETWSLIPKNVSSIHWISFINHRRFLIFSVIGGACRTPLRFHRAWLWASFQVQQYLLLKYLADVGRGNAHWNADQSAAELVRSNFVLCFIIIITTITTIIIIIHLTPASNWEQLKDIKNLAWFFEAYKTASCECSEVIYSNRFYIFTRCYFCD